MGSGSLLPPRRFWDSSSGHQAHFPVGPVSFIFCTLVGDVCSLRASLSVFLLKIFFYFPFVLSVCICVCMCARAHVRMHACHKTCVMSEDSAKAGFLPPGRFQGSNSGCPA